MVAWIYLTLTRSLSFEQFERAQRGFQWKNALLSNEKNAAILDYHMVVEEAAMNVKQKLYLDKDDAIV